jgi:subtilisin family serine protease
MKTLCLEFSWFNSLVLVVFFGLVTGAHANELSVYSGAVVSVRGQTRAFSAVDRGLPEIALGTLDAERIAPGVLHVNDRKTRAFHSAIEKPRAYATAGNPCRRAKIRRIMKQIPGHVSCSPNWALSATKLPDDTYYNTQYGAGLMSLPAAWDYTTGSASIIALVIDTGVDYSHPDISGNMWRNPSEIAGNGIDDDKNGYIDDIYGINTLINSGDPNDDNGHGTHAAGILGARGNNLTGIAGVAWNAKIVAAKFLDSSGSGSLTNAIKAISYGNSLKRAGHNVVVSNNSWGGGGYSSALANAILDSSNLGILFVAAAGNESSNNDAVASYPANYSIPNVVSVASVNSNKSLSSFSNYGASKVHIAAPGAQIASTYPGSSYVYMSGTSMAAPQVSGVALLAQSICNGTLSITKLKDAVVKTGTVSSTLQGKTLYSSIVNGLGAVQAAQLMCAPTPTPTVVATATPGTATPTPSTTPTPQPTATPTTVMSPTSTQTPVITATQTPQQPTVTATATRTRTATPTRAATSTSTSVPTRAASATATRTATASRTASPTRTATPTIRSTPARGISSAWIEISPKPSVEAGSSFNLALQAPEDSTRSTLAVSLTTRKGATYTCNPITLKPTTLSLNNSLKLTSAARFFQSISFRLSTNNRRVLDQALISNYQTSLNPSLDRAAASSVCTTLQTQLAWASQRGKWGIQRFRGSGSQRSRR